MSEDDKGKLTETLNDPLSSGDQKNSEWVKFDEDETKISIPKDDPPVLTTSSIHVITENPTKPKESLKGAQDQPNSTTKSSQPAVIDIKSESPGPVLRNVELSHERIQEGFVNGQIIVTLLPVNASWPWVTPAIFRPELVPEELMAQGLTLTVEDYVEIMEILTKDYRFTLYNVLYKRVLLLWITLAFCVLLALLFSGVTGILLFSLGVGWLFLNAMAIFLCMWLKLRIARGLEKCLARVNKQLLKHKIMIALDDRGNISCHKINLCFIYLDASLCISSVNSFLERSEINGQTIEEGWEKHLDLESANDIIIQGSTNTRVPRKQALAEKIYLRYLQRFGKDFLRHRLEFPKENTQEASDPEHGQPRHLRNSYCACQYAEEVLKSKLSKIQKEKNSSFFISRVMARLGFKLC